jgi:formate hydrogenlyase subunit 3/multisubunit Na+/H+ antiporter MnhD subunit
MENVKETQWADPASWIMTLGGLLPLWLLSLSIMAEGFPRPPISREVAVSSFVTAIIVSIVLMWKRWMTIELLLYSLFPFLLLSTFDEISTTYKTPFIILCTLILTAGVVGYQRIRSSRLRRWPILLVVAVITWFAALHATDSFWGMASDLGYEQCFPDAHGCAPLTGQETPWWILFFSL